MDQLSYSVKVKGNLETIKSNTLILQEEKLRLGAGHEPGLSLPAQGSFCQDRLPSGDPRPQGG